MAIARAATIRTSRSNKKLLLQNRPALCLNCHDDPLAAGKVKHQAVEAGDCLDCHAPHATNFKGLLKKSVKDTCAECHDDLTGQERKWCISPWATAIAWNATPRTPARFKGLLKKPVKDTCLDCHDDLIGKKKFVHQPVGNGECLDCHNPHATKIKGLLKKPVKDTCAECHDDIPAKNAKDVHQPVGDGDCWPATTRTRRTRRRW